MAVQGLRLLDFVVYGTGSRAGIFSVQADFDAALESRARPMSDQAAEVAS